jgi:selenocysteine-specific elongation factor
MAVIATAGHVDHGKSSLIRALTGTDPDRLAEEKQKGMTIDLGFAHCVSPNGTQLSFIDVPGHADFIRTMIAGVSSVDVALFVVDANEGWMPQSQEHLEVLQLLHVHAGVVVITKCDKVEEDQLRSLEADLRERLADSTIQWSGIVRTSVVSHTGIDVLIQSLETLVAQPHPGEDNRPVRLFIDRVFTIRGSGTIVTGTLEGSSISVGDSLQIARTGQLVRIREVQTLDETVEQCSPRSRCAINLAGIDTAELHRGDALIEQDAFRNTNVIDVHLDAIQSLKRPITHKGSFTVHIGTNMQSATMRIAHASSISPGEPGTVRLRFAHPLPLSIGDRVVVRDTGIDSTVGGGVVIDLDPRGPVRNAHSGSSVDEVLEGRGFISHHEAQQLTGQHLQATVGTWFALPHVYEECVHTITSRLQEEEKISMFDLADYEQEVIRTIEGITITNGVASVGAQDPLLQHPYIALFRTAGVNTPDTADLDRNIIRQLVHRKILFEHDMIAFHVDTLTEIRPHLESLWSSHPHGFTMSQFRDSLGITRKHAIPLATCLDKVGLTARAGDLRIRGRTW